MTRKPNPQNDLTAQALYRTAVQSMTAGRFAEGIPLLEEALRLKPDSAEILNNLGTACWKTGRLDDARRHYEKAVRLAPANALALTNYGALLMDQGELDAAEKLIRRAHAVKPEHPAVANNMGLMQCRRSDFAGAEASFNAALSAKPGWAEPHKNIGDVYRDTERLQAAEAAYRRAIELDPRNARAWTALGNLYMRQQHNTQAEEALRKAVALRPDGQKPWILLLLLLEMMNRLDEAEATLAEAKRHFTNSPRIASVEAKILRRRGKADEALAVLEDLLPAATEGSPGIHFFFELGQLYDEAGDADKAFDCFERGNALQAATPRAKALNKTTHTVLAAQLMQYLTPETMGRVPKVPLERRSPAFLVGFPRSGTTLLAQILSSHPGVYVGEERPGVSAMIQYLWRMYNTGPNAVKYPGYPAVIEKLQPGDIAEMRRLFFREQGGDAPGNRLLIDKMPINLIHAGVIHAVFPEAKFILALRHPCDCVLSAFMQAFDLNIAMARFNDLPDTARFYDEMFRVWEHTTEVMPIESHAIRYEDVVADFRPTVASLLSFLDLPWDDAVLEYDSTARAKERINTPSYRQVTQKIYTRASGRWLRYRAHLKPVLEILRPHADKYGYPLKEE